MDILKDYVVTIQSYPWKDNIVADALSKKASKYGSLTYLSIAKRP